MRQSLATSPLLRRGMLAFAAIFGLGMALANISERPQGRGSGYDAIVVARVGSSEVTWRRYREVMSDLAADTRTPIDNGDRRFALQRLIDEELLIQRARELGLDATVPSVRKAMASAVIAQVVAEASAVVPDDDELRHLYATERDFFSQPARYGVVWYRLTGVDENDREGAIRIHTQLSGGSAAVTLIDGATLDAARELPSGPMPAASLSNYVGATLTTVVESLAPGEHSEPLFLNDVWHIVYLRERIAPAIPSFDALRSVVAAEFARRNADAALQKYLRWLASRTVITIDPDVE